MIKTSILALAVSAGLRVGAQEPSSFHPIFIMTLGAAVPAGELASVMSTAPTAYVGLAFHRGRSRTSFEIGESFTAFTTPEDGRATIAVSALSVTRTIPLRSSLETFVQGGLGQSWAQGQAVDDRLLSNASHFGVAVFGGTGLRYGGRVGVLFAVRYMALVHSGTVLHVVPVELGLGLR